MPMPHAYRHAGAEWRAFLDDVRDRSGLATDNLAYTAIEAVLATFRARLTVPQALRFAAVLPAVPRAIFVTGWDATRPPDPFGTRAAQVAQVQALRPDHSLTPDSAIEDVAYALWRRVNHAELRRVLADLGPEATRFWQVDAPEAELATRFA